MQPPLRDCWSKSTPILKRYADALGETEDGDELAALDGREDLLQHLRFLDMAVYNSVFNPIATEGEVGASKALIDSYYNDPTREYEVSRRALEGARGAAAAERRRVVAVVRGLGRRGFGGVGDRSWPSGGSPTTESSLRTETNRMCTSSDDWSGRSH